MYTRNNDSNNLCAREWYAAPGSPVQKGIACCAYNIKQTHTASSSVRARSGTEMKAHPPPVINLLSPFMQFSHLHPAP